MEDQSFQSWEIRVMEELAASNTEQLLDLAQDTLLRLACSLGDAKLQHRDGNQEELVSAERMKQRIGRVAVLLDVLQLRYGDAAEEEEQFLKDIEKCLE